MGGLDASGTAFLILASCCFWPQPAVAYIGPGAGISALGALLAIVAGIIVALFGFLWYPIKRLARTRRASRLGHHRHGGSEA